MYNSYVSFIILRITLFLVTNSIITNYIFHMLCILSICRLQINYSSIEIKVRFNFKLEPDKRVRLYLYNYASLHPHNNDICMTIMK